ncbi:nuclear transport factor 2 family protein [Fredinandcohnia humi]
MPEKIKIVLESLIAYNSREFLRFKSYYDDACTFRYASHDKVLTMEEVFTFYESSFESSPNAHCDVVNITCAGEYVSVHERFTGILDSNGKETTPETIAVYKIHNQKIIELRHHFT